MIKVVSFHGSQGGIDGRLAEDLAPIVILGTATGGSHHTLVDDTERWLDNQWELSSLVLERDGVQTRHIVLGNVESVLGFSPSLGEAVEATATIGSGEDGEGQIAVTLVDKGADGNAWTLHLIGGTGDTGMDSATADVETKTITVVIDSDGNGDPRPLMAGSLGGILQADIPGHITAALDFTAGTLPIGTVAELSVITFAGGADAPQVQPGDRYWVIRHALNAGELAALPEADALTGGELSVIVQDSALRRVTLANLKAYFDAEPV